MPDMCLDVGESAELAELVQFLSDWLANDHERLTTSLESFVANRAYDITQRHHDRFVFLLGGNDGEPLFHPDQR
jgi:hypothetical protein